MKSIMELGIRDYYIRMGVVARFPETGSAGPGGLQFATFAFRIIAQALHSLCTYAANSQRFFSRSSRAQIRTLEEIHA